MLRLSLMLFPIIGTTITGIAMIASLIVGFDTAKPIMIAISAGFALSFPITWMMAASILRHSESK